MVFPVKTAIRTAEGRQKTMQQRSQKRKNTYLQLFEAKQKKNLRIMVLLFRGTVSCSVVKRFVEGCLDSRH